MKIITAFVVACMLTLPSYQASAQAESVQPKDLSAAEKKQKQARHEGAYSRQYGWHGQSYRRSWAADPSFDRSGRRYRPSVYSPCTIDLGYGRFTSCDR